jgi:serine/threonine-protein kinase
MSVATVTGFLQALRQYQLLDAPRLEEANGMAGKFTDPRALARELLNRNWLTAYQINQLFQGNGRELLLGSYCIRHRLGEGGMGRVFKAWHQKLGRVVALKVLHKEYLERPDAVRRFFQEIQASAQLSHPNIVFAFDADQIGDTHFLAMEYVDGIGLARLVDQTGPLPAEQACDYVRQAALGLQHAHERGLVHRDIKPSNLLIARRRAKRNGGGATTDESVPEGQRFGALKIIDFGLARLRANKPQPAPGRRLTRIGTVMGTPDFIAPEQAADTTTADIRADLYSLGCTFFYLLTARLPFPKGSLVDKLKMHETRAPTRVERLNPEVPPELGTVVRKLMAKKPEQRYQTPAELAAEMEEFLRPGSRMARILERARHVDVLTDLNLPGFFGPGAGSLSSTTIFGAAIK